MHRVNSLNEVRSPHPKRTLHLRCLHVHVRKIRFFRSPLHRSFNFLRRLRQRSFASWPQTHPHHRRSRRPSQGPRLLPREQRASSTSRESCVMTSTTSCIQKKGPESMDGGGATKPPIQLSVSCPASSGPSTTIGLPPRQLAAPRVSHVLPILLRTEEDLSIARAPIF